MTACPWYKGITTRKISTGCYIYFAHHTEYFYSPHTSIPHMWHRCQFLHPRGLDLPQASGPSRNPWYRGSLLTGPHSSLGWAPAWLERTWGGGFGQHKTLLLELLAWWWRQWIMTKIQYNYNFNSNIKWQRSNVSCQAAELKQLLGSSLATAWHILFWILLTSSSCYATNGKCWLDCQIKNQI